MKKKSLIIVIAVLLIVGCFAYTTLFISRNKPSPNQADKNVEVTPDLSKGKIFRAKGMNFQVTVPQKFEIEEKLTSVDLKNNTGSISVVRNATNYENLDGYILEFDSRRKSTLSNIQKSTISGLETLIRVAVFPDEGIRQKSYYIYSNYFVFILSTQQEALYSDLDQIAQSFRYTP